MKSQLLTALFALLTFSGHAFAGRCDLTLVQRGEPAKSQPQLERFDRLLSKTTGTSNSISFTYRDFETEISNERLPADTDRACFELAVTKAGEMQDSSVHIEVTEMAAIGLEERFIDAPSHPAVRWRFIDGWEIVNPRGTVSKNAITCHHTTETSFHGERVYAENCAPQ